MRFDGRGNQRRFHRLGADKIADRVESGDAHALSKCVGVFTHRITDGY